MSIVMSFYLAIFTLPKIPKNISMHPVMIFCAPQQMSMVWMNFLCSPSPDIDHLHVMLQQLPWLVSDMEI